MTDLEYILTTFWRILQADPGTLLPYLAAACAVTLVIAVMTDAMLRRRTGPGTPVVEKPATIPQ